MKFRNKTTETLLVPSLQCDVEPGGTVEPAPAYASGFAGQCSDDGSWEPADDEAKAAVADYQSATAGEGDAKPRRKPARKAAPRNTKPAETEPTPDATSSGDDEQKENAS